MIQTNYLLPFHFEAPISNPWDGQRPVEVWVEVTRVLSSVEAQIVENHVFPFWLLASGGALAGAQVPPERSTCEQPAFRLNGALVVCTFEPAQLDERASACLLSLIVALHEELPLKRVTVRAQGLAGAPVAFDPGLANPYPGMPAGLAFAPEIEDSEDDVRTLEIVWTAAPNAAQREEINAELGSFGAALVAGAFGVAPIAPSRCGCTPDETPAWQGGELRWTLSDSRFHWAALECLVTLCAALSRKVLPIVSLTIE